MGLWRAQARPEVAELSPPNQARARGELTPRRVRTPRAREGTPPGRGRAAAAAAISSAPAHAIKAQIVDVGGRPLARARYEVVDGAGAVVASGTTDHTGLVRHDMPRAGRYTVRIVEVEGGSPSADPGR